MRFNSLSVNLFILLWSKQLLSFPISYSWCQHSFLCLVCSGFVSIRSFLMFSNSVCSHATWLYISQKQTSNRNSLYGSASSWFFVDICFESYEKAEANEFEVGYEINETNTWEQTHFPEIDNFESTQQTENNSLCKARDKIRIFLTSISTFIIISVVYVTINTIHSFT